MRTLTAMRALALALLVAAFFTLAAAAADNYMFNEGSQRTMHCDEVAGGVCIQGTKLFDGEDGSSTYADVTANNELKVKHPDTITVDSELSAAAAVGDNTANPTIPFVAGFNMVWDGATWDRWDGRFLPPASAPGATQYIAVRCSDGTIFESCGGSGGAGGTSSNFGSAFPTPGTAIGFSDGTNMQGGRAIDTDTGAGTVYAQGMTLLKRASGGPVELGTSTDPVRVDPTGTTTQPTGGLAAEDAAVTGNPHQVAGRASIDEPTAVSADGDVVRPWMSRFGQQVVLIGHGDPEAPVSVNATASGSTTVIAAPGGTTKLCIMKGSIHNSHTANVTALLQDGAAGTTRWAAELPAEGGGSLFDFGSRGWCLTDNTLLNVNLSGASDVRVNVTEYVIVDLP